MPEELVVVCEDWTDIARARANRPIIEEVSAFRRRLAEDVEIVEDYEFLNLLVVRARPEAMVKYSDDPGCVAVLDFEFEASGFHGLLKGLEILHKEFLFQTYEWSEDLKQGTSFPNDRYV